MQNNTFSNKNKEKGQGKVAYFERSQKLQDPRADPKAKRGVSQGEKAIPHQGINYITPDFIADHPGEGRNDFGNHKQESS